MNGNSTAIYCYNGWQTNSDVFDKSSGTRFYENRFMAVQANSELGKSFE